VFKLTEFDKVPTSGSTPFLVYREWVGNAKSVAVAGDFNNWNKDQYVSNNQQFGVHEVRIPFENKNGKFECPIKEGQKYKIFMRTHQGAEIWRNPQHCPYALLTKEKAQYEAIFHTSKAFDFKQPHPDPKQGLRIYETHVGMSSPKPEVSTYKYFTDVILPMVKDKSYNAVQIMAIQEHSFYASFGYQVTSFFAASSRYGTPEEFKQLVEKAHELGIFVFLDLVHSHASKNENDGIANYDGSDFIFHHEDHPLWDSKVFNYKHPECLRFLMQNLRFWLDEFNIDGFRFDGCMSMMYWHRSAGVGYTGRYGEYFDEDCRVDIGAITYLRLAHLLFEEYLVK